MRPLALCLLVACACVLPQRAVGSEDTETDEETERPFYIPANAKLQTAGNVGMIALGPGWSFWDRRVDLDLLFGWVPPLDGPEPIFSSTLKLTFWPVSVDLGKEWRLRPISAGAFMNWTFGDEYFITQPDRYPTYYYRFSTAIRFGGFLGGSIGRPLPVEWLDDIDLYWELGFTDFELLIVLKNLDSRPLVDAFHLALGVSVGF